MFEVFGETWAGGLGCMWDSPISKSILCVTGFQIKMDCGRKNNATAPSPIGSEWQEYSRWRLDMGELLALGGWTCRTCFRLMCTLGTQDQVVRSKIKEFVIMLRVFITPVQPFIGDVYGVSPYVDNVDLDRCQKNHGFKTGGCLLQTKWMSERWHPSTAFERLETGF